MAEYLDAGHQPAWVPRDFGQVLDRSNAAAQIRLAAEYPGSQHITNTSSGHNIMVENAPIVIKAIEDVLAAIAAGHTTASGS